LVRLLKALEIITKIGDSIVQFGMEKKKEKKANLPE
jgi:hypothetical protein